MRGRTEVLLAIGAASALFVIAFAAGREVRATEDPDVRASSFVTGREGVRGLADAAERLGVQVERWRERPQRFVARRRSRPSGEREAFVLVAPTRAVTARERAEIVRMTTARDGATLVLAGERTAAILGCFGYAYTTSVFDSARVAPPGQAADTSSAWTHATIARASERPPGPVSDRGGIDDEGCPAATVTSVDTVLITPGGRPAALRLAVGGRPAVLVIADASLLRNRAMRHASTAPLLLDAVVASGDRLVFDEYHQGFGSGGSMAGVAAEWSVRHPLGWMAWQLIVVALLALLTSGVRFGPIRAAIGRERRSPLEHVRALATALAAARGHREAMAAMVRGLRRRLAPASAATTARDDWRPWLAGLIANAPNARAREHAERLQQLTNNSQPETAVLGAAHAVEDVWQSLRP